MAERARGYVAFIVRPTKTVLPKGPTADDVRTRFVHQRRPSHSAARPIASRIADEDACREYQAAAQHDLGRR